MDEGQATKSITILIAGRPYPLKIKAGDEATIRKIVKEINDKVNRFQLTYTKKDKQDCLSMAVLTYAVDLHKAQQKNTPEAPVSKRLSQIDQLLDQLLND
ncbi:MAG: cell division protein ZapA [Saprospiraceae bacterium]|nr:cell division protein ZapA [Saprospiraceae bacterium]